VAQLRSNGFGAIGAFLRSVGVYYSSVQRWERQEKAGLLNSSRGGAARSTQSLQQEIKRLRRQLTSTEQKLRQSEAIIELQKKISDLAASSLSPSCERKK
jgi:septal ring factor EnvC (AmiA/AmiB activator)